MNHAGKLFCLPALLAAAALASPACAADPEKTPTDAKLDQILKQVAEMQKKLDKLQVESELKDEQLELRLRVLKNRLDAVEQQTDRFEKPRVSNYSSVSPSVTPDLERDLMARLDRMERDVKNRLDRMEKRSAFYPSGDTIGSATGTTGSVSVQNLSLNPSTVRVNGIQYVVLGGQTVNIPNLPAGSLFTYEVVQDARGGYHPPRVRTVPANEAFMVYINP